MAVAQAGEKRDFEVLVSEPWTVAALEAGPTGGPRGGGANLLQLTNGAIGCSFTEDEQSIGLLSTDKGVTWSRTDRFPGECNCFGVLSDGTVLAMAYMQGVRMTAPGEFIYPRWISRDGLKTWEGPLDTPVHVPKGTGGTGDNMKPYPGPLFWDRILEVPDGRLLAPMYGYFEGDTVPITGFKPTEGFYKYRTLLVESRDRGASWSLVSTVAYDPQVGQESFCEPSLVGFPDGELVCIMRTGYTHDPMYVSRSKNGGRRWSKPVSTGLVGVAPRLLWLHDGILACTYGVKEYDGNRRERRLMFSRDRGRTWSHHTVVYAGYGGSYPECIAIEPGKLLCAYNVPGFKEPESPYYKRWYFLMSTITIRPLEPHQKFVPFPVSR
ncbi:MAG: exo-alpha-sialidase [Candidatus Hydrogenedentes bacterium]|nr:exo-alpha-sialidase [Candidatus Hydrogenedentota bacterium]